MAMYNWENTKVALEDLEKVLLCQKCNKIPTDPVNYNMCDHFFCKTCISYSNACPKCKVPSRASEKTSDHLILNLITGWKKLSTIVEYKSESGSENNSQLKEDSNEKVLVLKPTPESSCAVEKIKRNSKTTSKQSSPLIDEPSHKTRNSQKKRSLPDSCKSSNDSPARKSRSSTSKDIDKKNTKGETRLHVACIKGKVEQVKSLLEAGANPNTKDNAGWTPLLEAIQHGFMNIVELLLKYGVMVNVPGCDNITPLHEAVVNNKPEMTTLLIKYGANVDARSIIGLTPKDIAQTDEMLEILNSGSSVTIIKPLVEIKVPAIEPAQAALCGCGLDSQQQKLLNTLTQKLKLKRLFSYTPEVTHIIVPADKKKVCATNTTVIMGILQGKWIVNCDWMYMCLEMGELFNPEEFEVKGTSRFPDSDAPKRARINTDNQLPSIFNGCHIYLAGAGSTYMLDNLKLTKSEVITLIKYGNGSILTREPDPENIPQNECTVPYHSSSDGAFVKCSHYIIYKTGKDEPKIKYNMGHIKSLPVSWLFDCMETFNFREFNTL